MGTIDGQANTRYSLAARYGRIKTNFASNNNALIIWLFSVNNFGTMAFVFVCVLFIMIGTITAISHLIKITFDVARDCNLTRSKPFHQTFD